MTDGWSFRSHTVYEATSIVLTVWVSGIVLIGLPVALRLVLNLTSTMKVVILAADCSNMARRSNFLHLPNSSGSMGHLDLGTKEELVHVAYGPCVVLCRAILGMHRGVCHRFFVTWHQFHVSGSSHRAELVSSLTLATCEVLAREGAVGLD